MIESISDQVFDEKVLQSQVPVLVDFWAPWCGPCKTLAPVLAELADRHPAALRVVKVNIDDEPEKAQAYGVRAVPTLMLFRQGKMVRSVAGAQPLSKLEQLIAA